MRSSFHDLPAGQVDREAIINFLGIPESECRYDDARIAILPVPYEGTVSFGKGTTKGPSAIIEASAQVELYDEEFQCEPYRLGVTTLGSLDVRGVKPEAVLAKVENAVAGLISDGKCPFIFGGEHSITPAAVKAVHKAFPNLTAVQLDAHADLRDEYEGSRMNHACAMARVREICPVVQVGIRNISAEEAKAASERHFLVFYAESMQGNDDWMWMSIDAIETENVYLTLDVDVFDASLLPATGTPEPGGLGWYQVTRFLRVLNERKRVVGMDIVELAPIPGMHAYDFLVAKLAYKCIAYWGQSPFCNLL